MGKTWELVFFTRGIKSLPVKYQTHPAKIKGLNPRVLFTLIACANPLSTHLSVSSSFLSRSMGISYPVCTVRKGFIPLRLPRSLGLWVWLARCAHRASGVPVWAHASQRVHFLFTGLKSVLCPLGRGMKKTQVLPDLPILCQSKQDWSFWLTIQSEINKIFGWIELMIAVQLLGVIIF